MEKNKIRVLENKFLKILEENFSDIVGFIESDNDFKYLELTYPLNEYEFFDFNENNGNYKYAKIGQDADIEEIIAIIDIIGRYFSKKLRYQDYAFVKKFFGVINTIKKDKELSGILPGQNVWSLYGYFRNCIFSIVKESSLYLEKYMDQDLKQEYNSFLKS